MTNTAEHPDVLEKLKTELGVEQCVVMPHANINNKGKQTTINIRSVWVHPDDIDNITTNTKADNIPTTFPSQHIEFDQLPEQRVQKPTTNSKMRIRRGFMDTNPLTLTEQQLVQLGYIKIEPSVPDAVLTGENWTADESIRTKGHFPVIVTFERFTQSKNDTTIAYKCVNLNGVAAQEITLSDNESVWV